MSKGDAKRYENFLRLLSKSKGSKAANAARMIALYTWRGFGDSRAVEPLISVLGDKRWEARMNAACALGALAANGVVDGGALEALSGLLGDERAAVRAYAAASVRRYAEQGVFSEGAFNRLVDLLSDEDRGVRGRALAAVRRYVENGFMDEKLPGRLIPLLGDRSPPPGPRSASRKAAEAVAKGLLFGVGSAFGAVLADKNAQPLVRVLEGEELAVCGNAAHVLGALAERGVLDEGAVDPLLALVNDKEENNRTAAMLTLERYAEKGIMSERILETLENLR